METLQNTPTVEQVVKFLQDNRARTFVLDIETDSTIQPDENAEKQRRAEFMQAMSLLLPQLSAMVTAEPMTAPFAGELLKFSMAPYRAGRQLDGVLDEFVQQIEAKGQQPKPDPKQQELQAFQQVEMAKLKQKDRELQYQARNDAEERKYKVQKDALDRKMRLIEVQTDEQSEIMHANQGGNTAQFKEREVQAKMLQQREQHEQKMQQERIKTEGKVNELGVKERLAAIKIQADAAKAASMAQPVPPAPNGSYLS